MNIYHNIFQINRLLKIHIIKKTDDEKIIHIINKLINIIINKIWIV